MSCCRQLKAHVVAVATVLAAVMAAVWEKGIAWEEEEPAKQHT